jgi:hypothetical protein
VRKKYFQLNKMFFIRHFTQPSSGKITGIAGGLFEHPARGCEFRSARLFRAAQGSLLAADQRCNLITRRVNGCLSGSFWANKMNVKKLKTSYNCKQQDFFRVIL